MPTLVDAVVIILFDIGYNWLHYWHVIGEIHAMIKGGKKLLNPLVAAQNFEYKMSNILGTFYFFVRWNSLKEEFGRQTPGK